MIETLKLTIKKRFFDMIRSGEKTEEYREMKPFWVRRLAVDGTVNLDTRMIRFNEFRHFDQIQFFNGPYYSESLPNFTIQCKGIYVGKGHPEWGAEEGVTYFILMLGKIILSHKMRKWEASRLRLVEILEKEHVTRDLIHKNPYPSNN